MCEKCDGSFSVFAANHSIKIESSVKDLTDLLNRGYTKVKLINLEEACHTCDRVATEKNKTLSQLLNSPMAVAHKAPLYAWTHPGCDCNIVVSGEALPPVTVNSSGIIDKLSLYTPEMLDAIKTVMALIKDGNGQAYALKEVAIDRGIKLKTLEEAFLQTNPLLAGTPGATQQTTAPTNVPGETQSFAEYETDKQRMDRAVALFFEFRNEGYDYESAARSSAVETYVRLQDLKNALDEMGV